MSEKKKYKIPENLQLLVSWGGMSGSVVRSDESAQDARIARLITENEHLLNDNVRLREQHNDDLQEIERLSTKATLLEKAHNTLRENNTRQAGMIERLTGQNAVLRQGVDGAIKMLDDL